MQLTYSCTHRLLLQTAAAEEDGSLATLQAALATERDEVRHTHRLGSVGSCRVHGCVGCWLTVACYCRRPAR